LEGEKAVTKKVSIDIEYVYVEMVLNEREIISGLLQGIITTDNLTFVLLHGKGNSTNIVNLKFYNIMTIEVRHTTYKNMTHLTIKDSDQKFALNLLNVLYNDLLKNGFEQDEVEGLIDVSKYVNTPNLEPVNLNTTNNNFNQNSSRVNNTGVINCINKKKEIVPCFFSRTETKKPNKTHLVLIQEKIDQINKGEFKCKIPETFENFNKETKSIDNLYENSNPYWLQT
jgi:hypothetical protein